MSLITTGTATEIILCHRCKHLVKRSHFCINKINHQTFAKSNNKFKITPISQEALSLYMESTLYQQLWYNRNRTK